MENKNNFSRRIILKSGAFGLMAASVPNVLFAGTATQARVIDEPGEPLPYGYPSLDDASVAEVVGASHFDFDKVKELLGRRPELARASWDWAFGDWESALGAASHVGRRDIATLLIDHGARPDIFALAMLGKYQAVKAMIESMPGIEAIAGPHGISLLNHAKAGLRSDYGLALTDAEKKKSDKLVRYLERLGTADKKETNIAMSAEAKKKYLGDYRYGEGEKDGFTVKLNMKGHLALGGLGKSGGALYQKSPNVFSYNGVGSVEVHFAVENEKVLSLTVFEPGLTLKAEKV